MKGHSSTVTQRKSKNLVVKNLAETFEKYLFAQNSGCWAIRLPNILSTKFLKLRYGHIFILMDHLSYNMTL